MFKVITVATEYNNYVEDWETSAKMFGYDYKILGKNVKWNGFTTLMKLILDELNKYNDDDIVLKVDCYDLLFVDHADKLFKKYKEIMKKEGKMKVIIGTESHCVANCSNDHIKVCKNINKNQKYINGGFVMGPVKILKEGYNYCLKHGNEDDQVGWSKYFSKNCNNVILDYNSDLVLNYYTKGILTPYLNKNKLNKIEIKNGKIYNKTQNNYPMIVHIPYQSSDMGTRSEFIRNFVLPNRTKMYKKEYFDDLKTHLSKCITYPVYKKYIMKCLITIFIILIFLVFSYKYKMDKYAFFEI